MTDEERLRALKIIKKMREKFEADMDAEKKAGTNNFAKVAANTLGKLFGRKQ
jgi:hypothetical protein